MKHKQTTQEIVKRVKNLGINSTATIGKLLSIFLLAKFLPPEDFGLFSVFFALVTFGVLLIGGEYYTYINRVIITSPTDHRKIIILHHIIAILIIYSAILPLQVFYFLSTFKESLYIIWFLILLITEHVVNEQSRLLIALNKQIQASYILLLRSTPLLLTILILNKSITIELTFTAWLIANILSITLGLKKLNIHITTNQKNFTFDQKIIIKGFKVSIMYLASTAALQGILTIDRSIIANSDISQAGVYSFFMTLIIGLTSVLNPLIFSFLYPKLIKYNSPNNLNEFNKTYKELIISTLIISVFLSIAAFISIDSIIKFIDKPLYNNHLDSFLILILSGFFYNISHIPQIVLYSLSKDKWILISNIVSFLIFIFSTLILEYLQYSSPIKQVSISMLIAMSSLVIVKFIGMLIFLKQRNNFQA